MTRTPTRQRRIVTAGFVAALVLGGGAVAIGGVTTGTPQPESAPTTGAAAPTLPASRPVQIRIDRLGVTARVRVLKAAEDGSTLALPPLRATGWDATSATPGEAGITVVTGYIARTTREPGVLRGLARLRAGDVVTLRRKDGRTVDYRVTGMAYYPQGQFPATRVFTRTRRPELRLISTGGPLHRGDPLGNAVVTAVADQE